MKLLLVYPEIEHSITNTSTYSVPLGLGSIATYCKQDLGDTLEIKILDSSIMQHDEQMEQTKAFHPDILGINSTIGNQHNAYEIAETAKDLGSLVIFGGVHSTNLWKSMLNRNFIDAVVLYDAEMAMLSIIRNYLDNNSLFDNIPNVAYKNGSGKIIPPRNIVIPCLSELPDIDYSLFDLEKFFEQTEQRGFGRAISYYSGKGCAKRGTIDLKAGYDFNEYCQLVSAMDVCSFCGRNELGIRSMSEDREAQVVIGLYEKYGVTGFFNVQDTVNLTNTRPIGLNHSWFRLFIGTESITQTNIKRLRRRYGPNLIFQSGVESVVPFMRSIYGKTKINYNKLIQKVEMMREEGIKLHASFILGGRAESKKSMENTLMTIQKLSEYENVTWLLVSPQLILPGSPDYRALLEVPMMNKKYADEDLIDIVGINNDFLYYFAPALSRGYILEKIMATFSDIRKRRSDIILDIKGITREEELYVNPQRPYTV